MVGERSKVLAGEASGEGSKVPRLRGELVGEGKVLRLVEELVGEGRVPRLGEDVVGEQKVPRLEGEVVGEGKVPSSCRRRSTPQKCCNCAAALLAATANCEALFGLC